MSHEPRTSELIVVIIDDDAAHRDLIARAVGDAFSGDELAVRVLAFADPLTGLAELPVERDVVVLLDDRLTGSTGAEWVTDFVSVHVGPVILVVSSGDEHVAAEAFRQGAMDSIVESEALRRPGTLRRAIRESMRRFRLEQTNRDLARRLEVSNAELAQRDERLLDLTDTAHRFVDDVAHEFRTPLTVIKEFTSIMTDGIAGEINTKQARFLGFINEATCDLSGLIDDFLNSSKLRANTLRVDRGAHDPGQVIDGVWSMLESRAGAKGITLIRRVEPGLPMVFADLGKAQRALLNLVINAIRFSGPRAEIIIAAEHHGRDCVRIDVTDHGPGFSDDVRERLFDCFRQLGSSSPAESVAGFGLGLSIVKDLTAINLGEVLLESEVGVGSTFSFTLPIDEHSSIIDRFLACAQWWGARSQVAAVSVSPLGAGAGVEDIFRRLESVCRASDLVLAAPGGVGGKRDEAGTVVLGEASDIDPLRKRICMQYASACNREPMGAGVPIEITDLGQWPVGGAGEAVRELFCLEPNQERQHV